MVVYLDRVFLLNLLVDYLLICDIIHHMDCATVDI